jgi:hypothetical protein
MMELESSLDFESMAIFFSEKEKHSRCLAHNWTHFFFKKRTYEDPLAQLGRSLTGHGTFTAPTPQKPPLEPPGGRLPATWSWRWTPRAVEPRWTSRSVPVAAVSYPYAWKREHARCGRVRGEESTTGNHGERRMQSPPSLVVLLPFAPSQARLPVRGGRGARVGGLEGLVVRSTSNLFAWASIAAAWGTRASVESSRWRRSANQPSNHQASNGPPATGGEEANVVELLLQVCFAFAQSPYSLLAHGTAGGITLSERA